MSLGGLIPDLQLLITVEGVGGKEKKKKKKAPVFQERGVIHTRCGGSDSSWSFLERGFSSCFLFSQGCATIPSPGLWRAMRAQRGSGCDPCAFPAQPRSPSPLALLLLLRARGHNSNTQGHWQTSPHCSARWSCFREVRERCWKQSERMEKGHNQTWLK